MCFGFLGLTAKLHSPSKNGELDKLMFCELENKEIQQKRIVKLQRIVFFLMGDILESDAKKCLRFN